MLDAMLLEIELQQEYLPTSKLETIYFGGGTPSLLTADEINRFTEKIAAHFDISGLKEFTLEANPDDLKQPFLKSVAGTQVNRFSIGVQSFFDSDLKYMNRAHNAQEADYAIKAAQDAGFTNLTIDLIYGTPGLTDNNWLHNLAQVQQLDIPHFSSYALTVEEGTALHHNINKKNTTPVDADHSAAQFEILMSKAAEMGYEHYEISNLAREGYRAVHNTNYWLGVPYLGIGPSAHSFDGNNRRWNIANNAIYMQSLLKDHKLNYEEEHLTGEQKLNEYIMTSLRTVWGTDLQKIAEVWGHDTKNILLKNSERYLEDLQMTHENNTLVLTNKGKLFADSIAGDLFF